MRLPKQHIAEWVETEDYEIEIGRARIHMEQKEYKKRQRAGIDCNDEMTGNCRMSCNSKSYGRLSTITRNGFQEDRTKRRKC